MAKNTICIWYDEDAEAAARFYAQTFPDSTVGTIYRAPSDYPSGKKGDVMMVEFTVAGVCCIGLNGGRSDKAAALHWAFSLVGLALRTHNDLSARAVRRETQWPTRLV